MVTRKPLDLDFTVRVGVGLLNKQTMDDKIKKLKKRMEDVLVELTNIHNLAYMYDIEDSQDWIDYQDELNRKSIERKKK